MDLEEKLKKALKSNLARIRGINGKPEEIKLVFSEEELSGQIVIRTTCEKMLSELMGNELLSLHPRIEGNTVVLRIEQAISKVEREALVKLFQH